jgi:hypothetical protein
MSKMRNKIIKNKKWYYLVVLILFLITYSTLRFGFGHQLSQVHHMYSRMEDPNYLKNDWFVNNVDHFNSRTYFITGISLMNNLFNNVELTYFLLYILVFTSIFISFFYLAQLFFKNEKKSFFISCLSFIAITFSLDLTDLTKLVIIPSMIGWLFGLISLNFYFRKKKGWAFIMVGIALLFQAVIGSLFFAMLTSDTFFRKPLINKSKVISLIKTIPFFIISAFSIVPLTQIHHN